MVSRWVGQTIQSQQEEMSQKFDLNLNLLHNVSVLVVRLRQQEKGLNCTWFSSTFQETKN